MSWFTNPEHNQIEIDNDDPALSSIVSTRNAKIMKKVREYEDVVANGTQNASAVGTFKCLTHLYDVRFTIHITHILYEI